MKLNHLNLIVTNVADAIIFFETYFGFKCTLVKGDNIIAILKDPENFTLVLMTDKAGNLSYPKDFHIGFMLETANQVHETYKKLKDGNINVESEPRKIRDSFGFYFYFENIFIEVGQLSGE